MATLNVKNVPGPLYRRLKVRARHERRSIAQEVIHLLSRSMEEVEHLSILDLRGLGKEVWNGVDAASHVDRERAAWD